MMYSVLPLLLPLLALSVEVRLSNVRLPLDDMGQEIFTGEVSALQHGGFFYFYLNDWGPCPGVNCCEDKAGCATCCFQHPPHPYVPGCDLSSNGSNPYGAYHVIRAYRTTDFKVFENLGLALDLQHRPPGVVFRPHVLFNSMTQQFVMWYEDRSSKNSNYLVATSSTPEGPFNTLPGHVTMPDKGKIGDFHLFVDDDGSAYHVRTSFEVVRLNASYTGAAEHVSSFSFHAEAPVMLKQGGRYYILSGSDCCACIGGSSMFVHMADSPAGPWHFLGDIGSNPGVPFDPHSAGNYVTKAQGSTIFKVQDANSGEDIHIWIGNQWNSGLAHSPPGPRHHDLLYFARLTFTSNASLQQLEYTEETTFDMAPLEQTPVIM
mmetsp:Transcript_19661/g.45834  ORF Transcript_19661/g.45834 Transcript_19661/m.45834 type:complete len:375 (-) Transcript_19661:107-1231(-)